MTTIIKNIHQLIQIREKGVLKLCGNEMNDLPYIENAYLIIENDFIQDYGLMKDYPNKKFDIEIDAKDKIVLPSWCDSHTHIVYAGSRVLEFVDRIKGLSYEEIAKKGGGILNSAKQLQAISDEELYLQSSKRVEEVIKQGTGAVEIKSGYGLTVESELKILRIIKKLKENYPIDIKATFLGAHAFPAEFKENKNGYVDSICNEMIPKVAEEKLAEFIDVFLETGYFSNEDADKILNTGSKFGLIPKIHVNQFTAIDGIKTAIKYEALSVDHLEIVNQNDIEALKNTTTMPVALPGCSFFIQIPYTPVKELLKHNLPVAIASDFNPGTTPTGNMNFIVSLACIQMKLTPEQAINAATLNGAYAMNLAEKLGSITKGKKANLIMTRPMTHYAEIAYNFASNCIDTVFCNGKIWK